MYFAVVNFLLKSHEKVGPWSSNKLGCTLPDTLGKITDTDYAYTLM